MDLLDTVDLLVFGVYCSMVFAGLGWFFARCVSELIEEIKKGRHRHTPGRPPQF